MDSDSSIAYIKVKSFSRTYSEKFYKETFAKIKNARAKYLIIDIRNNYGGSLDEINNLYSYLAPEPFTLIKRSQVTSKNSPLKTNYFRKSNALDYTFKSFLYPAYIISQTLNTYKKDSIVYYKMKADRETQPQKDAFHGKVLCLSTEEVFQPPQFYLQSLKMIN
jgi:hypothetical protein